MEIKQRKQMRLLNFDYNQNGYYFITICTKDMQCLLSSVVGADDLGSPHVELKNYGKIVEKNINLMNDIYKNMNVESYAIMPNHIHLLIHIFNSFQGSPRSSTPTVEDGKYCFFRAAEGVARFRIGGIVLKLQLYYDMIIKT